MLMWEIGKSLKDSEKEFDRTIDYIMDTIDALKELDRRSSRFEIKDGIIGQIRRSPLGVVLCMGPFNYPMNEKMKIYHEEQFGPVIPVLPFNDIEEPLRYIVQSKYGQQVSIFGKNPDEVAKLTDPLVNQVCRVNINSQCQRGPDTFPFTGRKDSAEGTLSVSDALRVFSIRSLFAARENDLNKQIITTILRKINPIFFQRILSFDV